MNYKKTFTEGHFRATPGEMKLTFDKKYQLLILHVKDSSQ